MNLAVDTPGVLLGLLLALPPLFRLPLRLSATPWGPLLPADAWSRWIDAGLRLAGALAVAALTLGLAGLHRGEYAVEQSGQGAHTVLLLDRSRSMDDSFAGRTPTGDEESKSQAAQRILSGFVAGRRQGLIGVAAFSTSALFVLPLTGNREAVLAAVSAMRWPALAQTHVAKGLAMALTHFQGQELQGARSVLLVSDGAAAVDADSEALLRRWFREQGVKLYWIYLRTAGSHGLFEVPENPDEDNPQSRPERYLHLFFTGLGVPYQAFEAADANALQQILDAIGHEEQGPMLYLERVPRRDLQAYCYAIAALAVAVLLGAKGVEVTG